MYRKQLLRQISVKMFRFIELVCIVTFFLQLNRSNAELNAVTSATLPGNPFTTYTIWLKVRTFNSDIWSNETTFQFRTLERVPYQQPVLNQRGFSIFSHDDGNRDVMIYWKPVPMESFNGRGFHYVASVKSSVVWETLTNQKTTDAFLEIQLKREATDVRIIAQNDMGNCTAPQEPIHIPSFRSGLSEISPVYEVIVELDTRNFSYALIHWSYVSEPNSVTGITVFWCSSALLPFADFAHCKTHVEWKELSLSQKQYVLSSDDGLSPIPDMKKLQAGVSVDLNGIPCGIKWSTSLYALNKVAPPPENVQVVIPDGSDHGYVYLTWKKPKCSLNLPCGYADEFLLVYCLVSSVDSDACVDKNYSVRISSQKFAYNLTGLRIGSNYKLWMLSHSKAGFSIESDAVYTATTKPWKTPGAIVGIAFGSIVILIVIIIGLYGAYRYCNKYKKKLTRGVEVVMPKSVSVQRTAKTSTSSETQILYNSYPSGYSRQGSDMSTLSRDSGRFSLTQCIPGSMNHQELSPIMTKSNGTIVASTITPLIGIQEDANADDVFPNGFDSSNYVKTTVIDDPADELGYKFIRSVNPFQVDSSEFDHSVPDIQYKKPATTVSVVCPAKPMPNVGVYSRPDLLLSAAGHPNNGAYIRIQPDADKASDVDLFSQSVDVLDAAAASSLPSARLLPPPSVPLGISDISYTTVEMLNPNLSFPISTGPGVAGGGNALENGYTDIAFLNNSFLGNASQADNNNSQTRADRPHGTVACEGGAVGCNQPHSSSHPLDSSDTSPSYGQSLNSVTDCLKGVSSDPNYAHIGSNLDWNPIANGTLAHPLSVMAADGEPDSENNKASCVNVIPSSATLCDNGYVHHNGLFNKMLAM